MASKTGGTKILNHCELCKYFHLEVQEGGGWLEDWLSQKLDFEMEGITNA